MHVDWSVYFCIEGISKLKIKEKWGGCVTDFALKVRVSSDVFTGLQNQTRDTQYMHQIP